MTSAPKKATLLLTGGGTAGHVTPNLALIEHFQKNVEFNLLYVGSTQGIERQLIEKTGITYCPISTGKLHRYWSWHNVLAAWKVAWGILQGLKICWHYRPQVVFAKGGFVTFPIVVAAWISRIPVILHESDITLGLANRLSKPFARLICVTFPITADHFKNKKKVKLTGLPVRERLFLGNPEQGRIFLGFNTEKPILLVWGGSLGALTLNNSVHLLLIRLLKHFQVVHLCGKNNCYTEFASITGYRQFEYLDENLADVIASAELVVSRAGATAIVELLLLKKPHILCPLSNRASRGEQIQNAQYLESLKLSTVIYPDFFHTECLFKTILTAYQNLHQQKQRLEAYQYPKAIELISEQLLPFLDLP